MRSRFSSEKSTPIKKELADAIVITTLIGGTKNYISALDPRQILDNQLLPSYSNEKESAKTFNSHFDALATIPKIVNHLDRVFTIETVKIERPMEV